MRLLRREDIEKLISIKEVIDIMREVFAEVGKNNVVIPERSVIDLNNRNDAVLFMPGYIPETRSIGIKIVSVFPGNVAKGIPTVSALVLLNDADTGQVVCAMDGGYITSLRTGAVSALATDLLATNDADRLGIFGSGVQASSQIQAILEVREIKTVRVYDVIEERSKKLVDTMKEWKGSTCHFEVVTTPKDAVADSDIIVTATTSRTPVFEGRFLKEGTHINSIGSFKPNVREVDDETITRARIFVDACSFSLKEGGDLIIPLQKGIISEADIKGELGELVLGKKKGRENDKEITFFKSVGMSVQDIAVAKTVYEKAVDSKLGTEF